jgi:hypothetical protein
LWNKFTTSLDVIDQLHLLLAFVLMFQRIAVRLLAGYDPRHHFSLKARKQIWAKRYKLHTKKKCKIHRKRTSINPLQAEKILDNPKEVSSMLRADDRGKIVELIVIFKQVRKDRNSRAVFSDEH